MNDFIDLSKLLQRNAFEREVYLKVDLSGKPNPKDVRVLLDSGIEVRCDVRYDGLDPDGTRRFMVIAEIDWEKYLPTHLIIGEHPTDVTIIFKVPGMPDEMDERARRLILVSEKIVAV